MSAMVHPLRLSDVAMRWASDRPHETLFARDHASTMESQCKAVTDIANRIALRNGDRLVVRCLRSSLKQTYIKHEGER